MESNGKQIARSPTAAPRSKVFFSISQLIARPTADWQSPEWMRSRLRLDGRGADVGAFAMPSASSWNALMSREESKVTRQRRRGRKCANNLSLLASPHHL